MKYTSETTIYNRDAIQSGFDNANDQFGQVNDSITEYQSSFSQRADAIEIAIDATTQTVTDHGTEISKMRKAFSFESDGLHIKGDDSRSDLRLDNEVITFTSNGVQGMTLTGDTLNIENATVKKNLQFGHFAWFERTTTGNMALKWIGGSN